MKQDERRDYSLDELGGMSEQEAREREERRRRRSKREQIRRRRRRRLLVKTGILCVLLAILIVCIVVLAKSFGGDDKKPGKEQDTIQTDGDTLEGEEGGTDSDSSGTSERQQIIDDAAYTAAGYDYDGAIAMLQTIENYEADQEIKELIARYQVERDACVPVDVNNVPHIFYHSLINDVNRALNPDVVGESAAAGQNAWMTTIEEFDKITQAMYDNGYA